MKLRKLTIFALVLTLLLSLTACGASPMKNESAAFDQMAAAGAPEAPMEEMEYGSDVNYEYSESKGENGSLASESSSTATAPTQRKWIITMDITAETEDLDALMETLRQEIADLNGYVEDQNVYNGSAYAASRYRSASLTVRIPAADVDKFADNMAGMANVVRSNKNLEDITLTYVSTESRVQALETEQARLLELMEQADNMSDLLEIEARLTDVRYELENYTSRLRVYDNQVDYATVYLNLEEVQEYTPVAERTVWQRITEDFAANLESLGDDLVNIFVWFVVSLPYLVVWAAVIAAAVFLIRRLRRRRPIKAAKRKNPEPPREEKKEE